MKRSPSGAGKTTLTRALAQRPEWQLALSVSVTTRARRASEIKPRRATGEVNRSGPAPVAICILSVPAGHRAGAA
jgi:ABC-type molybdenum transport system ATPase subunit/photorepair protein PhrA